MSRAVLRDAQQGFGGGLNEVADEAALAANEFRTGENVRLTVVGAARRRGATQRLTATPLPDAVQSGFSWLRATSQELLVVAGGTLYTMPYAIPLVSAAQVGALDPINPISIRAFRSGASPEVVYLADGGGLNRWDGTTLTVDLPTPLVTSIAVYNSRLYGVTGTDEKVHASVLEDGDLLGASNGGLEFVARTHGNQRVLQIHAVGQSLLLFHERGVSRLTGISIDDLELLAGTRGVSQQIGTMSPRSFIPLENSVMFATDRGFYLATEAGISPISSKTDTVLLDLTSVDLMGVIGELSPRTLEAWWHVPGKGTYAFHYRLGQWSGPWTGVYQSSLTSMWQAEGRDGTGVVMIGGPDGHIREADAPFPTKRDDLLTNGTGGTTFPFRVQCHRMYFGTPTVDKAIRRAVLLANLAGSDQTVFEVKTLQQTSRSQVSTPPTVAWGQAGLLWGQANLTWGGAGLRRFHLNPGGSGPDADVTIFDEGDTDILISQVSVDALQLGRR